MKVSKRGGYAENHSQNLGIYIWYFADIGTLLCFQWFTDPHIGTLQYITSTTTKQHHMQFLDIPRYPCYTIRTVKRSHSSNQPFRAAARNTNGETKCNIQQSPSKVTLGAPSPAHIPKV